MSTPIIESIALNIETTINLITVVNGFNQDLVALRPRRIDFVDTAPADGIVLIKQDAEDLAESQGMQESRWQQKFVLMAIVLDSDEANTSLDTRLNKVRADIQKKLMEDRTRGGYAKDTRILPSFEFDNAEGTSGIAVEIIIEYATVFNDPYTQT